MTGEPAVDLRGRVVLTGNTSGQAATQLTSRSRDLEWLTVAANTAPITELPTVELSTDTNMAEGSFTLTVDGGTQPRIVVTGDPFSGVIYGANALADELASGAGLAIGARTEIPALQYRTFWNWDHSTNWELSQIGHQEIGVFNTWSKPPDGFFADFTRVIDFMSLNRIAAVVIYGFLRDSHGGVETAQELCRYAAARGVRIIPGIAIGAYGGAYWEGSHRYNLAAWLDQHPQFEAHMERGIGFQLEDLDFPLSFPRSDYTRTACPSAPETMAWMTEAVTWLAETFDIGGINIESGDYGVCGCARCQRRRQGREDARRRDGRSESWSHTDMADNFPRLFEAAKSVNDDLWIYCEMQWDNLLDDAARLPLAEMPPGAIYQHTMNRTYWQRAKHSVTRELIASFPTQPNVLRCQFACQWNGDRRTERYDDNSRVLAAVAKAAHRWGMSGLTIWGEPSPYHVGAELNYLAFARFAYEPSLDWDTFIARDVAPLFGGPDLAAEYLTLMGTMDAHHHLTTRSLDQMIARAREAGRQPAADAARRWCYLEDRLQQRRYMGR